MQHLADELHDPLSPYDHHGLRAAVSRRPQPDVRSRARSRQRVVSRRPAADLKERTLTGLHDHEIASHQRAVETHERMRQPPRNQKRMPRTQKKSTR